MSNSSRDYCITNINIDDVNTSSTTTPLRYNKNYNQPILTNTSDTNYKVAVTRLSVPTSNIELLKFTDRTKYKLGFMGYNKYQNSGNGKYTAYVTQMPNEDSHGIRYLNNDMIIEMMNRCLLQSHIQFISEFDTFDTNAYPARTTSTPTLTNASPTSSQTFSTTYEFCACEVQIRNVVFNSPLMNDDEQMELYLSHGGVEIIAYKGSYLTFKTLCNNDTRGGVQFSESNFRFE